MEARLRAEYDSQRTKSKEIDAQIRAEKRAQRNHVKLLLLGSGESGKSTFVKQLRIIKGKGYNEADCREFRTPVYENVLASMEAMLAAMERLGIEFEDERLKEASAIVRAFDRRGVTALKADVVDALHRLWNDGGVQKCYDRRREYQLADSTDYYLNAIKRLGRPDYVPSVTDILRVRVPTTGVIEYAFQMDEKVVFRVIDVGGQKSERRKWIHCFDNVMAIIFLVSLIEYDLTMAECEGVNRMVDSMNLFRTIINYQWFKMTPIIIMFNKTDLLRKKVITSNIRDFCPDFQGDSYDFDTVAEFIRNKYLALDPVPSDTSKGVREIYPYNTCATDTEAMKFIISAVKDIILQRMLSTVGMM